MAAEPSGARAAFRLFQLAGRRLLLEDDGRLNTGQLYMPAVMQLLDIGIALRTCTDSPLTVYGRSRDDTNE